MRLRLVVKRHSLPDTPVAWTIDTSNSPTISQLLEQVNEVLPLESGGDWGLEDYAVEIKGLGGTDFECLHFQQVASILHEDDEVIIRPLLSVDLKLRKVSGRQQITSDGRHLFDGSAFGRPRPRGIVDRPTVEIPPRKRRRIVYDEDTSDDVLGDSLALEAQLQITGGDEGSRELVVRANFDDDDEDDEDEDDDDFELDEDSNEDMDGLDEDLGSDLEGLAAESTEDGMQEKVRKLREAFPKTPVSVCEHVLIGSDGDLAEAWESLSRGFKPAKAQRAITATPSMKETLSPRKTRSKRATPAAMEPAIALEDGVLDEDDEEALLENEDRHTVAKSLVEHYDQHGLPPGSISTSKVSSKIINITLKKTSKNTSKPAARAQRSISAASSSKSVRFADGATTATNPDEVGVDSDDESDDEDFNSDDTSDDNSSDSSSDSSEDSNDIEGDEDQSSSSGTSSDSDSSDDDGSSSSDSGSEPEEKSSRPADSTKSKPTSTITTDTSAETSKIKTTPSLSAPGQGKKQTQRRNARRRLEAQRKRFEAKGIIPAGMTHDEFRSFIESKSDDGIMETFLNAAEWAKENSKQNAIQASSKAAEFRVRRDQLLLDLASGGVDVGPEKSSNPLENSETKKSAKEPNTSLETPRKTKDDIVHETLMDAEPVAAATGAETAAQPVTLQTPSSESTPSVRRKLNLGAAGRLLFGALGVRTPKTQEDREKVRNDLMKHIRPLKKAPTEEEKAPPRPEEEGDPEAWREVITLRAVECCHEGIELSPAPFPFVQRWDPQQQGSYYPQQSNGKRGGKGKRKQRDQSQYYEYGEDVSEHTGKKQKNDHPEFYNDFYGTQDVNMTDGYWTGGDQRVIPSDRVGDAANDQLMKDASEADNSKGQAFDEEDLPDLPEDMTQLTDLVAGGIKAGMVIAFKQLTMSEETNWQPQISAYRTATVNKINDNGEVELTLAMRDRQEKYYDEETGERIYGKFDVPDDDDQDEADDGFLSAMFAELLEPKIVRDLPADADKRPAEPSPGKATGSIDVSLAADLEHAENAEKGPIAVASRYEETINHSEQLADAKIDSMDDFSAETGSGTKNHGRAEAYDEITNNGTTAIPGGHLLSVEPLEHAISLSEDVIEEESYKVVDDLHVELHSSMFNGFDSDVESIAAVEPLPLETSVKTALAIPEDSSLLIADVDRNVLLDEAEEAQSHISSVEYPKLSIHSSLASVVTDYGHQPDFPTPGDDTLERFEADGFLSKRADSPLEREEAEPPATFSNGDDFDLPPSSIRQSVHSNEVSSDDEMVNLEDVFSTARSQSYQPKVSRKDYDKLYSRGQVGTEHDLKDSYNEAMAALDADILGDDEEGFGTMASLNVDILGDNNDDSEAITPTASQRNDEVGSRAEGDAQVRVKRRRTRRKASSVAAAGSPQVDPIASSEKDNEKGVVGKKGTRSRSQSQSQSQSQNSSQTRRVQSSKARVITPTEAKARSVRRKTTPRF